MSEKEKAVIEKFKTILPQLTELEMAAEKTEVMLWDLDEHYFSKPEPDKAMLLHYYQQMGIRTSIARDYLLELFDNEFIYVTPHTFRHTFATRAIESGMQPQTLKTILGHSSLAMTMDLYSHVMVDTKRNEMEKIENAF